MKSATTGLNPANICLRLCRQTRIKNRKANSSTGKGEGVNRPSLVHLHLKKTCVNILILYNPLKPAPSTDRWKTFREDAMGPQRQQIYMFYGLKGCTDSPTEMGSEEIMAEQTL